MLGALSGAIVRAFLSVYMLYMDTGAMVGAEVRVPPECPIESHPWSLSSTTFRVLLSHNTARKLLPLHSHGAAEA